MKSAVAFLAILFAPGLAQPALPSEPFTVTGLRCEYRVNPVGLDVLQPRLSWTLAGERRGERQTAYRILVASSADLLNQDRGDLWDSGEVPSDQTLHVVYGGQPLRSRLGIHWKVRAWDKDRRASGGIL